MTNANKVKWFEKTTYIIYMLYLNLCAKIPFLNEYVCIIRHVLKPRRLL